jgi:hypothetical protein
MRGNFRRAGLAAAAILVSLAALAAGPAAAAPRHFYGTVQATALDSADFKHMHRAGVGVVRFQLFWPSIQPTRHGGYTWSGPDSIVRGAARRGMDLLPVLFGRPAWAAGGCHTRGCSIDLPIDTAKQRRGWRSFVGAAVRRYGPGGHFWKEHPQIPNHHFVRWQIWNEQNNFKTRRKPRSTPGQYARLVRISRRATRHVDQGAKLMLGGMFGTPNDSTSPKITAWGFLAGLYRHGLAGDFDSVAIHPYSPGVAGVRYQVKRLHRVMKRHHDGATPLFVTELGWGSDGAHVDHPLVKSLKGQKRLLKRSFRMLRRHRAGWGIGGVYWFTWRDPPKGTGLCGFCYSAGLYRANGKAKPALAAYRRLAR